jgi:hypothetical protein
MGVATMSREVKVQAPNSLEADRILREVREALGRGRLLTE